MSTLLIFEPATIKKFEIVGGNPGTFDLMKETVYQIAIDGKVVKKPDGVNYYDAAIIITAITPNVFHALHQLLSPSITPLLVRVKVKDNIEKRSPDDFYTAKFDGYYSVSTVS